MCALPCRRGDNIAAPYNIGDTTLGAEAYRLIAEKLSGAKDIYVLNKATNTLNDTKAIAVREGNTYFVYIANSEASAVSAQLTLTQWSIPANAPVFVNRVAAATYGEVTEQLTASNGVVTVVSKAWGCWRVLSVLQGLSQCYADALPYFSQSTADLFRYMLCSTSGLAGCVSAGQTVESFACVWLCLPYACAVGWC